MRPISDDISLARRPSQAQADEFSGTPVEQATR